MESIEGDVARPRATLSDGTSLAADLIVGADGVRSGVRRLAFGPDEKFWRYLGFCTAAFILPGAPPAGADTDAFSTLTEYDRQVGVYPIRGGRTATFFVHRAEERPASVSEPWARDELRRVYGDMGWVVPELLERMDDADAVYFDEVAQIEVEDWTRGAITLVGDAGYAVSLLAGQGASLAMAGAYVLAARLRGLEGDAPTAALRYADRFRPIAGRKQKAGRSMAHWFLPSGPVRMAVRDAVMRAAGWAPGRWILRRQFAGDGLPD